MIVTLTQFLRYQEEFYRQVEIADKQIELGITSVATVSDDFLVDFTGSNERGAISWTTFNCLFDFSIAGYTMDKNGIANIVSGAIYLSPGQLVPIYDTFIINPDRTIVKLSGHEFLIDSVRYLEQLYDSCLAIELRLKDKLRG